MTAPLNKVSKAKARYEVLRTLLQGALVVVVILTLAFSVYQNTLVRDNQRTIQDLLKTSQQSTETQAAQELQRQASFDRAVEAIAAEQYRALVAHDLSAKVYLQRALTAINAELNGRMNQESAVMGSPPSLPPRTATAPPTTTKTPRNTTVPAPVPSPAPAPAPAPAPCDTRGKSGKCK